MLRCQAAYVVVMAWIVGCAPNPRFYALDTGSEVSTTSDQDHDVSTTEWGDCVDPVLELDFTEGTVDPRLTFYRGTSGTYVDVHGRIQPAMIGMPRFEHVCAPSCIPVGLLVEDASTNEVASDLSTWTPSAATLIESTMTAPDGTASAYELVDDIQNLEHMLRVSPGITADGQRWTFSVFAKAGSLTQLRLVNGPLPGFSIAHFSLVDGELLGTHGGTGEVDTFVAAGSHPWPDGWWRVWLTFHAPIGTKLGLWLGLFKDHDWIYAGAGESLFLWGPQLEQGVVPTSFIPTNDAPPGLRGEDVAFLSLLDWLDPLRGTFVVEFSRALAPTGDEWVFQLGDQTGASWIGVHAVAPATFAAAVRTGGAQQSIMEFLFTVGQRHRVALAYGESRWAAAVDGGPVVSHSEIILPSTFTKLDLGDATPQGAKLHGHIASVRYYDCQHSDEHLRELSAP